MHQKNIILTLEFENWINKRRSAGFAMKIGHILGDTQVPLHTYMLMYLFITRYYNFFVTWSE